MRERRAAAYHWFGLATLGTLEILDPHPGAIPPGPALPNSYHLSGAFGPAAARWR